jgi:hypothetical protein
MIRVFELDDLKAFEGNDYSDPSGMEPVLCDMSVEKYSVISDGLVKCIICFFEYLPRSYGIFFLAAKNISNIDARQMKRFLEKCIVEKNPKNCVTYSKTDSILEHWHVFFGFEKTGNQTKVDGVVFNEWVRRWE